MVMMLAVGFLASIVANVNAEIIKLTCVMQDGSEGAVNYVIDTSEKTIMCGTEATEITISEGEFKFIVEIMGVTFLHRINRSTGTMSVYCVQNNTLLPSSICHKTKQLF